MTKNLAFVFAALCGTTVSAQCAVLEVISTNSSLTFAITGAQADQFAFLILGQAAGSSSAQLGPFGTINFGMADPWVPYPLGMTGAAGVARVGIVPPSLPSDVFFYGQGLTLGISPTLNSCTTNVVAFRIG